MTQLKKIVILSSICLVVGIGALALPGVAHAGWTWDGHPVHTVTGFYDGN